MVLPSPDRTFALQKMGAKKRLFKSNDLGGHLRYISISLYSFQQLEKPNPSLMTYCYAALI